MEFEMGSVFEIFKETIIPRKISKMDIEAATSKGSYINRKRIDV